MSWWIDSTRFRTLTALSLTLGVAACLSERGGAAPVETPSFDTNALVLPPGDHRVIVDDEAFEKCSGKQVEQLAKEGKLVGYTYLAGHVPLMRGTLTLPSPSTNQLTPPGLAEMLRHSTVAIGLRYQPPHSKKWTYMIGATAFAVAPEILSTSLHVMTIDPAMMREAQAVAVTEEGKVFPITEIIASSDRGDTCLVRAPGLNNAPLPIRPGVEPGEPVWCMSHPDGFTYMFTSGQVARISRERYDKQTAPGLHVEVTAEYCPGSSGGAVCDSAGNVIAQVSSINQYRESDSPQAKTLSGIVSARTCTAAEEILALTSAGTNDPVPLPLPVPKKKHRAPKAQATPVPRKS
jgi:hypothetical protein